MIMAGGTGGHVYPALAVARELMDRGNEVVWMGTRKGLEARVVPAAGIPVEWLAVEGVRGKGIKGALKAPFMVLKADTVARNPQKGAAPSRARDGRICVRTRRAHGKPHRDSLGAP